MIHFGPVFIDALESLWIASNLLAIIVTIVALRDALADRADVRRMNGQARTIVAQGDVRRERLRLVSQVFLLATVVPGLFLEPSQPLDIFLVIIMAVPLVLLTSSLLDLRDRRRLAHISLGAIAAERKIAQAAEIALARVAEAEEAAAARVKATAVVTATDLKRGVVAAERTADATERLADAAKGRQL